MLQVLLENEQLQRRIGDLTTPPNAPANASSTGGPASRPAKAAVMEYMVSQRAFSEDRTNQILAQAEKLRLDIAAARDAIKAETETNAGRKSDLKSASSGIEDRRARTLDGIVKSTHTLQNQWDRSSDRMAATRGFLCMEAARLYGLRRVKKGSSRYEFKIGGIEVIDLATMNSMSFPAQPLRQRDGRRLRISDEILTFSSLVSRDYIHLLGTYCPHPNFGVPLSRHQTPR